MKKSISFILICSLLLSTMQPLMAQKEEIEEQQAEPEVSVIELQKAKPLAVLSWFRSLRKPTWQDVQKGQDYVNSKYRCLRYGEGCSKKERAVLVTLSALVAATAVAGVFLTAKKLRKEVKEGKWRTAVEKRDFEEIQRLIDAGIDVNKQDNGGETALMKAVLMGDFDIVKELFKVPGIDVNIQDNGGQTALMKAALMGDFDIVKELLKVPGIDVNKQNDYDHTALMLAAAYGQANVVKELLKAGADWAIKNWDGKTALDVAIDNNLKDIIKVLIKAGADYSAYLEVPIVREVLRKLKYVGTFQELREREIGGGRRRR